MKKYITALALLFGLVEPALAQWQVPDHAVPIGRGPGFTGFKNAAPGTAGAPLVSNGAASDPSFQVVPNAGLAQMPANTIKCNNTGSTANAIDCTGLQAESILQFQQPGTGGALRMLDSKVKEGWISVLDYGAVSDGATDNATAITNAYNALVAKGGGTLYFPTGNYVASSFPTISSGGITIRCDTNGQGTSLQHSSITGDFITITGGSNTIVGCSLLPTVRKTSGYQINISGAGAYRTNIMSMRIWYALNGIVVSGGTTLIKDMVMQNMLGGAGIYFAGSVSAPADELTIEDVLFDNLYPNAQGAGGGPVKTWAISTAFSVGDVISNNGKIYQVSTAGTSAGSGTGPSGFPTGTTPLSAFTGTITDGTVQWKFVADAELNWIVMDSYTNGLKLKKVTAQDGTRGLFMLDNANTGSSYPSFVWADNFLIDHPFSNGVDLGAGSNFYSVNSNSNYSLVGNGMLVGSAFKGVISITNFRTYNNWLNGINTSAGDFSISNSHIHNNSLSGSGANHGILVGANISKVIITGNRLGKGPDLGAVLQGYGVSITAGTGTDINVSNNVCGTDNVTGCINNGATGTRNRIHNNSGYNPVGVTAATTMGASPFTYTAGPTPETHYVKQAATNTATITQGGQQIAALIGATTYYTIHLGPNESYVTTWVTTAPTYTKFVH